MEESLIEELTVGLQREERRGVGGDLVVEKAREQKISTVGIVKYCQSSNLACFGWKLGGDANAVY